MIRNGIHEKVAMIISGHKTRSIFDRYNITNYADLVDAGKKIKQGRERIAKEAENQRKEISEMTNTRERGTPPTGNNSEGKLN
jgi:hypothetical protein